MVKSVKLLLLPSVVAIAWSVPLVNQAWGAEHKHAAKVTMEQCRSAVLKAHPGTIVKLEMKIEKGEPRYEFDIESDDGKAWDIECSARTGQVVEVEQEVTASDPAFSSKAKVDEATARDVALKKHPGEVIETEYEIESDGAASYEFDIRGTDGKEHKVEVDATTGKIVEDNEEIYQIGREKKE